MTDNLRIWSKVEKTNPAHTKHVNQRGGFTAISAQYQVLAATEAFGPIGIGWGYITGDPVVVETLMFVPVTLWHGNRENTFGPMLGCEEWKDKNGRVDSDAGKKAVTDAITKLLSQLGFNADVFLGKFDDNKYVEQRKREVEQESSPRLTDDQRNELTLLCEGLGFPVSRLLDVSKITDLRQLPADKFDGAKRWVNTEAAKMKETENA